MSKLACIAGSAVVLVVFGVGCNHTPVDLEPSYSELLVTYNAELEALDRLEAKREKLINEYAVASEPPASGDTLAELEGLLKSANSLKEGASLDQASDPNSLLDDLTARHGEAQEIAGQLLDGLRSGDSDATKSDPTPEEAAAISERKAAFEAELASLDAEISEQKGRVERARQARDAAEERNR